MSLLVVGALHWDVVVRAPRLPMEDETLKGSAVDYRFGGKGGNQAVAAARAGARTAFAGRVGSDDAGRAMRDVLVAAGVDVRGLRHGSGASGMSVAIEVADGGYGAVIVSGENLKLAADDVALPDGCRIVLMQNEMAPGLVRDMAARASAAGAEVWLNAAPSTGLGSSDLAAADVLILNRVEGADLADADPDEDAEAVLTALAARAPGATVILTLGAEGVAWAAPGGEVRRQAAEAVEVVSTHGAGDVFVGTLAAARLGGLDFEDAIGRAQAAAAAHVSQAR